MGICSIQAPLTALGASRQRHRYRTSIIKAHILILIIAVHLNLRYEFTQAGGTR